MGNLQLSPGGLFANRFELGAIAGSGGMGTVYRARDLYDGGIVALKVLHAGGSDEDARFSREARLLSELRHPGIVSHLGHGQTPDGSRYLAMEWLEGQDLSQRLRGGPLPIRDCLCLVARVADALAFAHQRGVIHRDLKPSNLYLPSGDIAQVKILDFGIARRVASSNAMTRTGNLVGTPEYMAPEQARGSRELTSAADIFSLGCVLYECLTGQPPFVADHIAAVLARILFEEPVPIETICSGIPESLVRLLKRLLAKDPAQRIGDAALLRAELADWDEVSEPAIGVTLPAPTPPRPNFGSDEQNLFSVVLAVPEDAEPRLEAQRSGTPRRAKDPDRLALLRELTAHGAMPDFLANGTLIVTVPPMASALDQAAHAARAALLVKARWPAAAVAMATGRGTIRGRAAVGEVVELAARSLQASSPAPHGGTHSGVLTDPLSAKLLEGRFAQTPQPGGVLLLSEELSVDASRPLLGKPTPCVGREPELANLEAQLTGCLENSEARVTLVTAAPGIGKSRLRHEFMRRIERRNEPLTCLLGRGELISAGAPYGILRAAIQSLCGLTSGESLSSQRERLRTRICQHVAAADQERVVVFIGELCNAPFPADGNPMLQAARQDPTIMRDCLRRAVLDWLAAECRASPTLVILDDLQWGDELTVSVLDDAMTELAGAPLFILAFSRPELHEIIPKLWRSQRVQEIALKGLSKRACERLIFQVLGRDVAADVLARTVEQCAGNALFLEELIRSIAEGSSTDHPETLLAMLQSRIGRLDPGARRAVRAASVLGQTFWQGGVAAILGTSRSDSELRTWLTALSDAELIQGRTSSRLAGEKEYRFRHALVRDAAYSLLTASDIAVGHRLAGEYLDAAGERDAAVIADHFECSGDKSRALLYYLRAVEDNLAQGNNRAALRHVDRALGCEPQGEPLGQLRSAEAYLAQRLNRYDRMGAPALAALELLRPGTLSWCRAMTIGVVVAMTQQEEARCRALVAQLLATEPEPAAYPAYVEMLSMLHSASLLSAPAVTLQYFLNRMTACVAQAESLGFSLQRYLWYTRASMAFLREPAPWTLVTVGQRAIDLSDAAGDRKIAIMGRGIFLEWGWWDLGDVEGVRARLTALEEMMTQSQEMTLTVHWRHLLARTLCASVDESAWEKAEQLLAPVLADAYGQFVFQILARDIMARVALLRERYEEAEAHARVAMQFFSSVHLFSCRAAPVQIAALLALGRLDEACAVADQVLRVIPMLGGLGVVEVEVRLAVSEAFYAAGNLERAQAELRETMHQIELRTADISDAFWKDSYRNRNSSCVRAHRLAKAWGLT